MNMKRKSRSNRDMMEDKAFIKAITRFRKGDQYLKIKIGLINLFFQITIRQK